MASVNLETAIPSEVLKATRDEIAATTQLAERAAPFIDAAKTAVHDAVMKHRASMLATQDGSLPFSHVMDGYEVGMGRGGFTEETAHHIAAALSRHDPEMYVYLIVDDEVEIELRDHPEPPLGYRDIVEAVYRNGERQKLDWT